MFRPASSFLAAVVATLGLYGAPAFAKDAPVYTGTFSNAAVPDVQKKWEKDIPGFITKGQQNWPGVLGK